MTKESEGVKTKQDIVYIIGYLSHAEILRDTVHTNLHRYFNNATPAEEIYNILATNHKVRNDKFVNEIIKVLDANFDNYYKEGTYTDIQGERGQLMELERKFGWHN